MWVAFMMSIRKEVVIQHYRYEEAKEDGDKSGCERVSHDERPSTLLIKVRTRGKIQGATSREVR